MHRERSVVVYVTIYYLLLTAFVYFGLKTNEIENFCVKVNWVKDVDEITKGVKWFAAYNLVCLPSILLCYASSPIFRVKKGWQALWMFFSFLLMIGLGAWIFWPTIPKTWEGTKTILASTHLIPNICTIIAFMVFYGLKCNDSDRANSLFWEISVPLVCTIFLALSPIFLAIWIGDGFSGDSVSTSDFSSYDDTSASDAYEDDGPCIDDRTKVWHACEWKEVERTGSRYSYEHGGYVDEYETSDGNRFISPDDGETFYED